MRYLHHRRLPGVFVAGLVFLLSGAVLQPAAAAPTAPSPVPLGTHRFGDLQRSHTIVARAGPGDAGFSRPPAGQDGDSYGPWSFDVARDGSIWLLDEINHRLLVWPAGQPDRPARSVRLPKDPLERVADFAVGPDGTIYATYVPPPGPGPKTMRLCALTPTGQVRWTAATSNEIFNAQLRLGPDGAVYTVTPAGWTPLTSGTGRPLPVAEQRRRTSPQQPMAGGLRLATTEISSHERRFTLSQAGQPQRSWRVTSRTELGAIIATPALVGGDLVVGLEVSRQTKTAFLYEHLVLRLSTTGAWQRFAFDARAAWGDTPITGLRVGTDGRLYQLRTSPTAGVSIARYPLGPTKATPSTASPAAIAPAAIAPAAIAPAETAPAETAPAVTIAPATAPPATAPMVGAAPIQPVTPAAAEQANAWLVPGLAAVSIGALAALGVWLLYRRRHPARPGQP